MTKKEKEMPEKPSKKPVEKPVEKPVDTPVQTIDLTDQLQAVQSQLTTVQQRLLDVTKERDDLVASVEDSKEQALRAMAELENVKRRKDAEKMDAIKFANESLFNHLLPVLDAFEMAIQQTKSIESDDAAAIVNGFELIQKQMEQFLERCSVTRIVAVNEPFDPNLHQAISSESHPDLDENTIVKEMQPGYVLNGRVIRASMVIVSTK